jgi:hypothetical protein
MTYFETPNQQQAFYAGVSVEAWERAQDNEIVWMEELCEQNRPDMPREHRPAVSASDMHPIDREV